MKSSSNVRRVHGRCFNAHLLYQLHHRYYHVTRQLSSVCKWISNVQHHAKRHFTEYTVKKNTVICHRSSWKRSCVQPLMVKIWIYEYSDDKDEKWKFSLPVTDFQSLSTFLQQLKSGFSEPPFSFFFKLKRWPRWLSEPPSGHSQQCMWGSYLYIYILSIYKTRLTCPTTVW